MVNAFVALFPALSVAVTVISVMPAGISAAGMVKAACAAGIETGGQRLLVDHIQRNIRLTHCQARKSLMRVLIRIPAHKLPTILCCRGRQIYRRTLKHLSGRLCDGGAAVRAVIVGDCMRDRRFHPDENRIVFR